MPLESTVPPIVQIQLLVLSAYFRTMRPTVYLFILFQLQMDILLNPELTLSLLWAVSFLSLTVGKLRVYIRPPLFKWTCLSALLLVPSV